MCEKNYSFNQGRHYIEGAIPLLVRMSVMPLHYVDEVILLQNTTEKGSAEGSIGAASSYTGAEATQNPYRPPVNTL